jgi:hypothetical protein
VYNQEVEEGEKKKLKQLLMYVVEDFDRKVLMIVQMKLDLFVQIHECF